MRELEEEATIKLSRIVLCLDEVITDIYRGTDCQLYQTDYFVIKVDEMMEPVLEHLDTNCIGEWRISHDMANYAWVSIPSFPPRFYTIWQTETYRCPIVCVNFFSSCTIVL